jgi:hypothetical protein
MLRPTDSANSANQTVSGTLVARRLLRRVIAIRLAREGGG